MSSQASNEVHENLKELHEKKKKKSNIKSIIIIR